MNDEWDEVWKEARAIIVISELMLRVKALEDELANIKSRTCLTCEWYNEDRAFCILYRHLCGNESFCSCWLEVQP